MLSIKKRNGNTYCQAVCDKCGYIVDWSGFVGFSWMEKRLREYHKWRVGKEHLCEKCKPKVKE
jgi:hypothetical protein